MRFAILGPLLVHDGKTQVDVPKGRQRVLLAALLVQAGKPVAADALAQMVWDGSPPPSAAVTLRSHVQRLRRVLGPRAGARLVTRPPGYLLQAGEDEVDLLRFRHLCRDGGAALREGAWDHADALLGEALDLWRGAPLADIPSESLRRDEVPDLEALRLQAEEWRIDAALHLGRHDELIPGLQSLAAQHPLRERFHGQLMLALYRCGRQAEALAAYQHARDVLDGELGVEPGPGLRELHQRILSADLDLAVTEPARPTEGGPQRAGRRELPPTVPQVTGRARYADAGLLPARRRARARRQLTAILLALAAAIGVPVAIVSLKTSPAPPIGEQIGSLDQRLGDAAPAQRVVIMQRLMVIANGHPGTESVSNPILADLISFAVDRSRQPRPAGQPPPDLLYALRAIGGGEGGAFVDTPNMTKYLSGANLAGLNLAGLQFNTAILVGADLRGTDLRGAGLISVKLAHARLQGADLTGADLTGADLSATQLQDADLRGAKLAGADFSGANLNGATLPCDALPQTKNVPPAAAAHCAH